MTREWIKSVALSLLAVMCCGAAGRAQEKVNFALVKAKVVSLGEKDRYGGVPATLEVLHVYKGPKELKGQSFTDVYGQNLVSTVRQKRLGEGPFEVGEEGLWSLNQLIKPGGEVGPWKAVGSERKKGNEWYDAAVAIAEATERLEDTKPEGRLALLRGLIADDKSLARGWAVRQVGRLTTDEATEYLKGLAAEPDPKWPFAAQWALDEVLCRREGVDWQGTKQRDALLRRWVGDAQTEKVAGWVLMRLDQAHYSQELTDKLAVELFAAAAGNTKWAKTSRRYALEQLWRTANRAVPGDARTAAWECVFGHMRTNGDLDLRRSAAEAIGLFPLYPARLKVIEEHLVGERDEKVATTLRAAVKKAKEGK